MFLYNTMECPEIMVEVQQFFFQVRLKQLTVLTEYYVTQALAGTNIVVPFNCFLM